MYRVVQLFGVNEPWWFLDGWEEDIVGSIEFPQLNEAILYYKKLWQKLHDNHKQIDSRDNFQAAFWDEREEVWCEECGDYLQLYHGLALLKDNCAVEMLERSLYEGNHSPRLRICRL